MKSRARVCTLVAAVALAAGCASEKKTVEKYTKEATSAAGTQRSTDAEGLYVSAVERARASLGKQEQSDALFNLGTFYRRQARFKESLSPLIESATLAQESGRFDDAAIGRRYTELARSYAALNRWQDGAGMLRNVVPLRAAYQGEEASALADLFDVYRTRLTELGLDARFIP